jgi:anhydro-N-acetylmuramic acid kinase
MTVSDDSLDESRPLLALGLMSGTSLDGVDAALLVTDGKQRIETYGSLTLPYDATLREQLRSVLGSSEYTDTVRSVERTLTLAHLEAVQKLLAQESRSASEIHVIGLHGHTLLHRPDIGRTWQIGDGALLASKSGIDVVADFRSADVAAGGEGAPFAPVFHAALSRQLQRPVAILNLGGVANVTWIGTDDTLLSFDTGPGNALIDDWVRASEGSLFDAEGELALAGSVDEDVLRRLLAHPYFGRPPPKSLDRNDFDSILVHELSIVDGAATLTEFTAAAVACGAHFFPAVPMRWLVTGGGRHNPALMKALANRLGAPVAPVESVGWDGDALEAQAFAFLAVRSLRQLPLTFSSTTGVASSTCGGRLFEARL